MNEGRLISSRGLDIAIGGFEAHFTEHRGAHSTALHCRNQDQNYRAPPQPGVHVEPRAGTDWGCAAAPRDTPL